MAEFTQVLQQLPTGSLLAAAFITYLGGEPEDVRQATLTQWYADLKVSPPWSLIKFLASETELLTWKSQGKTTSTYDEVVEQAHVVLINNVQTFYVHTEHTQILSTFRVCRTCS